VLRLVAHPEWLRPGRACACGRAGPDAEAEKQGPGGERVKGAVRGAAAGAVIGEVADNDAGKGAEVGAAAGVLAGGRQSRKNKRDQEQKVEQTAQANEDAAKAAQQQKVDTFKRGDVGLPRGAGLLGQVARRPRPVRHSSGRRLGDSCQRSRGTTLGSGGSPS
jgi:hypothetical protein